MLANRPTMYNFNTPVGTYLEGIKFKRKRLTPGPTLTYLGITLNNKNSWTDHLLKIRNKTHLAQRHLYAMQGKSWGVDASLIKIWYKVVIEKIITYAAPIWGQNLNRRELDILASCQRPFLRAIVKPYRTAPTSALQVLSGILPIHIAVQAEATVGGVLRLGQERTWHSSVFSPGTFEPKIRPMKHHPTNSTLPSFNCNSNFHLYTDGSKSEVGTGASVVHFNQDSLISVKLLRLKKENSVFQAEAAALQEAVLIAKNLSSTTIHSDSLSALQALSNPHNTSPIINNINTLLLNTSGIRFNWTKAHVGTLGNELADHAAKIASQATHKTSFIHDYTTSQIKTINIPLPRSHIKQETKKISLIIWQEEWNQAQTGRTTHDFFPIVKLDRLISDKWLTQLYTGHGSFPTYLHRFKISTTPYCCCGREGTPLHYLFSCPLTKSFHTTEPNHTWLPTWKETFHDSSYLKTKATKVIKWLSNNINDIMEPHPE